MLADCSGTDALLLCTMYNSALGRKWTLNRLSHRHIYSYGRFWWAFTLANECQTSTIYYNSIWAMPAAFCSSGFCCERVLPCYCCALASQLLPGRMKGTVYDALLSTAAAPKHTHICRRRPPGAIFGVSPFLCWLQSSESEAPWRLTAVAEVSHVEEYTLA